MQPTSSPVKVGVIGIGNMGWHHARVLSLLKDASPFHSYEIVDLQITFAMLPCESRSAVTLVIANCLHTLSVVFTRVWSTKVLL